MTTVHARPSSDLNCLFPNTRSAELTLFQRLARLYVLGVKAIFVFDGPDKPLVKRNRSTYQSSNPSYTEITFRRLVEHFGFLSWDAAGEAEAECAKLLELGVVDLIVTDDVDALMFGAEKMITNWHNDYVNYFDMNIIKDQLELDRDGLVLIGLLSGNDYVTSGSKSIGIYTAVGLAKSGIAPKILTAETPNQKIEARDALVTELNTNASGKLDRKRPSAARILPEDFPDSDVVNLLRYPKCRAVSRTFPSEVANLNDFKEPNLTELAASIQLLFQLSKSDVVERMTSLVFPGYVLQCVRSEIKSNSLKKVEHATTVANIPPTSVHKKSKINSYFTVTKNIPSSQSSSKSSTEQTLKTSSNVICINRERQPNDAKTCHVREYQVQINPRCMLRFVDLVENKLTLHAPGSWQYFSEIGFVGSPSMSSSQDDSSQTIRTPVTHGRQSSQDGGDVSDDEDEVWKYRRVSRSDIPQTPRSKSIASIIKRGEDNPKLQGLRAWSKVNRQWMDASLLERIYPDIVREFQDKKKAQAAKSSARSKNTKSRTPSKLESGQRTITTMLLGVQKSDGAIEINDDSSILPNVVSKEDLENPFLVEDTNSSPSSTSSSTNSNDILVIPPRRKTYKHGRSGTSSTSRTVPWLSARKTINLDSDSDDGESVLSAMARHNRSAASFM